MKPVIKIVDGAKEDLRKMLELCLSTGGLTKERYQRFLSMQYHLTKGVQKHFFALAGHPEMAKCKGMRDFLIRFAIEEENHYLIAKKDLENMKSPMLENTLDVQLWWAFFDKFIHDKPFMRLGATCVLENISDGNGDLIGRLTSETGFLNARNTRFLVIHQHEELPHGDQLYEALEKADLDEKHVADLLRGAEVGRVMYLRFFSWVLTGKEVCMVTQID